MWLICRTIVRVRFLSSYLICFCYWYYKEIPLHYNVQRWTTVNTTTNLIIWLASDNYMFQRIMVAIIRLCSYKGELNTIASSKWLDVEVSSTLTLSIMHYYY